MEIHKWFVVKVPDWNGSTAVRNITGKKFTQLRKIANRGLQRNRTKLWLEYKAAVLITHINNPEFKEDEVHLIDKQDIFNK